MSDFYFTHVSLVRRHGRGTSLGTARESSNLSGLSETQVQRFAEIVAATPSLEISLMISIVNGLPIFMLIDSSKKQPHQ